MTINFMWRETNHEIVRQQLKTSSKQALTWYSNNFLSANPERFQFLLNINPRKVDGDTSDAVLSLDGLPIDKSEDIKLLGVHIDGDLDFKKLCIKTSRKVRILSRLRDLIPSKAKLLLYKAFILPHLTYYHLIWHFCKSIVRQKEGGKNARTGIESHI